MQFCTMHCTVYTELKAQMLHVQDRKPRSARTSLEDMNVRQRNMVLNATPIKKTMNRKNTKRPKSESKPVILHTRQ